MGSKYSEELINYNEKSKKEKREENIREGLKQGEK